MNNFYVFSFLRKLFYRLSHFILVYNENPERFRENRVYGPVKRAAKGICKNFVFGFLFLLGFSIKSFATIIVTAPTNGQNLCSNTAANGSAPGYTTLGNITVTEGSQGDFEFNNGNTDYYLTLSAPSGWQFNASSTLTYAVHGPDINSASTSSLSSSSLVIHVNGKKTNGIDYFTISGLQIEPISTTSPAGNITASSYTGFNGITSSTNFGTLSVQAPASIANTPLNYCGTLTSGSLGGNTPSSGSGLWTQNYGPGTTTFSNASSGNSTATATAYGTYVYTWTTTNGTCATSANVTVNYYATPTVASVATGSLNVCGATSGSLGGNTPTTGTGAWTQTSGPGTASFSNPASGSSTASVSTYGTYTFKWTITNGTCASSAASVTVNYYAPPTAASVSNTPLNYCGTLTSGSLGGNTPSVGTGSWTQTSGPGTTTFSNPSSGSSTATASTYGTYTYTWTISNGTCASSSASVTVTYNTNPTTATVATSPLNYCGTLTSGSLGGNTPSVGTGSWSQTSGPGTTTFSNASLGSSTATATAYGTYVYTWTITNGTCSTSANVTVNYYATPTIASVATGSLNACGTTSGSLGGNTPTTGTGTWTQTSGPGTASFSNPSSGSSTASVSTYGTYTFTWTISNGTCASSAASVTVNYYAPPTVASVSNTPLNYCGTLTSGSLGGNTPAIGTGTWTQTSGPGTTTFSNASSGGSTATASTYGTYIYTWTISNGTCASSSASVTVDFNANPTIINQSSNSPQIICVGGTATALSVTATGYGLSYQWYSNSTNSNTGGTIISGATSGSYTPSSATSGTLYYYVEITDACSSMIVSNVSGAVTVSTLSVGGTASANQTICYGNTASDVTLAGNTGSVLYWQKASDPNFTVNVSTVGSSASTTLTSAQIGAVTASTYYRAVVQNNPCSIAYSGYVLIAMDSAITPTVTISPSTTICLGQQLTLSASGYQARDTILGGDFHNANPTGWSGGNANNSSGGTNDNWGESTSNGKVHGSQVYNSPFGDKFQVADGLTSNASHTDSLTTPVFSTIGRTLLTLDWYQGYNFNGTASGQVQISIDGGITFTTLATFNSSSPAVVTNPFNDHETISLNAYLGQADVQIRFLYTGTSGSAWAVDNVNVLGPYEPLSYSWPSGFTVNANGNTATYTPTSAGTFTYNLTTTGTCGSKTTPFTFTVDPVPVITNMTASSCSGSTFIVTPANGTNGTVPAGTTYSWSAPVVTGGMTGGAVGNNQSGISGTLTNPTNTPQTATYTITPTAPGSCSGNSFTVTVTVNPMPSITAITGTACSNNGFSITPTNGINGTVPSGTTYSWSAPVVTGSITGGTSGTNQTDITGTLINSTTSPQTATYTVTPTYSGSCSGSSFTVTVSVSPSTNGGNLASVADCGSGSGNLTLTGYVGSIIRWESSTDQVTWTNIANTSPSQPYTATGEYVYYRALVQSGPCSSAYSTIASVALLNYWTGATSTDWNTASNWTGDVVPSATTCPDVWISLPVNGNLPVVSNSVPAIGNLHILTGATVTINSTGTLTIGGTISETNPGTMIARDGTLDMNGTVAQTIPDTTFANNALNNLIIENSNGTGVTLGGEVDIYQSVTFGSTGTTLASNGYLTLKSLASQTAWVGPLSGSQSVTGDVTVERYIATGNTGGMSHGKSWQLLAIPTTGSQTINAAWQEGATQSNMSDNAPYSVGNPNPGYGTMITGSVANAATWPTPGFDAYTPTSPSIKVYNSTNGTFSAPSSTATPIYNQKGYFVFVRGDRSINSALSAANPTVLRTKGLLMSPDNLPPSTNVGANSFESIGNPYASSIDIRTVRQAESNVDEFFIVWDPRLTGSYGYGAYQYLYDGGDGNYYANPGGGSYGSFGTPANYIQSGQAFLVQNFSSPNIGTVNFSETDKANGSALVTAPNSAPPVVSMIRTTVSAVGPDDSTTLLDGVLNFFNKSYSDSLDDGDARKLPNSGFSLSILKSGVQLAIEKSTPPTEQDTILLNWANVSVQNYRFEITTQNLPTGLQGFLVDNCLKTSTPLNMAGTTTINFNIQNIASSYAANRFMIVFTPTKVTPVTFVYVKAYQQGSGINIEWKVDNESNIKEYTVEKSTDGNLFTTLTTQDPANNNGGTVTYHAVDTHPESGYNYYRVKSVDVDGAISYTTIINVLMGSSRPSMQIYPNPVTDGVIHLQLVNQPPGNYKLRLLNNLGQLITAKEVTHPGGSSTQYVKWNYNLSHGMYKLEVTKPDGSSNVLNVMY